MELTWKAVKPSLSPATIRRAMVAYRFCRPDDIPLLVRAVNECFVPYWAGARPVTVESFRADMKELDVWPSNSMVAMGGDEPIGVSIGTKRATEVLVMQVGVKPAYRRQGHGSHLVQSLSQKLAVLGPPRLVAEVPDDRPDLTAFFTHAGWARERTLVDWHREPRGGARPARELFEEVDLAVGEASGLVTGEPTGGWIRRLETLRNLDHRLRGLALVSPDRVEAVAYGVGEGEQIDLLGLGSAPGADPRGRLGALLAGVEDQWSPRLRMSRVGSDGIDPDLLAALGFSRGSGYHLWSAAATAL